MTDKKDEDKDPLGRALGITPYEAQYDVFNQMLTDVTDDSAVKDFEIARSNFHSIINDGKDAIMKLALIAESSQHPRAYEVLAKLMETILNANERLLDMQIKVRDIHKADQPVNQQQKGSSVTNNLFVGSTAELQKILKEMRENKECK
jgi:hypothetical protein